MERPLDRGLSNGSAFKLRRQPNKVQAAEPIALPKNAGDCFKCLLGVSAHALVHRFGQYFSILVRARRKTRYSVKKMRIRV